MTIAKSSRLGWGLTLLATLTMAVSYFDRQILSILAPTVAQTLSINDAQYGYLSSAFSMAYLLGAPCAGFLLDRMGARKGLLLAVTLWSLAAASHSLAVGFLSLMFMRIALGFSESPSFPGASQVVNASLVPADRARGFGILFTGSSIGAMIAPGLATYLNRTYGWRVAFLGSAVAGLVWIPMWIGIAFRSKSKHLLDKHIERTKSSPWSLMRHRAVQHAAVAILCVSPLMAFCLLWGSKLLVQQYGIHQNSVGKYLWLPPVFFDLGAIIFGDLSTRYSRVQGSHTISRKLAILAILLCLSFAFVPIAKGPWTVALLSGLAMAGCGAMFAMVNANMMVRVAPQQVALAGGLTAASQSMAYILANIAIGEARMQLPSYNVVIIILAILTVPGALVWAFQSLQPREPT